MVDYVDSGNKQVFVETQLALYSGKVTRGSGHTFVCCPFHAEDTPSGRIFHSSTTRVQGYFKCYGCKQEAVWDKVAPLLGLKPFTKTKPQEEFANLALLDAKIEDDATKVEKIKHRPLPKGKQWRGIKTNMLRKLGATLCNVYNETYDSWSVNTVYLPCLINKKLRGYIKARIEKHEDYPSYINASGKWSKTHGLFPYDYAIKVMQRLDSTTMLLVEGPRDALRLLQYGIPAMCILGTHSWTDNKSKLLELGGVDNVLLFMDGDCAGKQASKLLEPLLEPMFSVRVLKLWATKGSPYLEFAHKKYPSKAAKKAGVSLWDPGNCPVRILKRIKTQFFTKKG